MLKLHRIFLIILLSILQGCGTFTDETGIGISDGIKILGATDNRRAPEKNPRPEDLEDVYVAKNPTKTPDDNQSAYQNYQTNDNSIDFKKSNRPKRKPKLNTDELNKSMDKAVEAKKLDPIISKPLEITGQSNLNEVINYNKQQKAKSINNPSKAIISSSKSINTQNEEVTSVSIKPPVELQIPVIEDKLPNTTQVKKKKTSKIIESKPSSLPITPEVKRKEPAPAAPVVEVVKPIAPAVKPQAPAPVVEEVKPTVPIAPVVEETKPIAPIVKQEEPAVITPIEQVKPVDKSTTSSLKSEEDIRNLSHDEFKRALKDKFKNSNTNASEQADTPPIEVIDEKPTDQ